jgi:hypothetical protein
MAQNKLSNLGSYPLQKANPTERLLMSQVEQISQTQHLNGFDDILERMHTHPLYSHDGAQAMPISKITRKNKYAQQKKIVVDSGYPRGNSLQPPVKLM